MWSVISLQWPRAIRDGSSLHCVLHCSGGDVHWGHTDSLHHAAFWTSTNCVIWMASGISHNRFLQTGQCTYMYGC